MWQITDLQKYSQIQVFLVYALSTQTDISLAVFYFRYKTVHGCFFERLQCLPYKILLQIELFLKKDFVETIKKEVFRVTLKEIIHTLFQLSKET